MKRVIGLVLFCFVTSVYAFEFDIGVSGRDNDVDGFYFSIGDHYRVPQSEVMVIERSISRGDINVAYFLAQKARRDVRFITKLRQEGRSWWDISVRLGLNPHDIYVVNTYNDYGPPYGNAYGHNKRDKNYRLQDSQIVELVNVRFLSDYHRISPDEVIERRHRGNSSYSNRSEYREKRHNVEERQERREVNRVNEYPKQERKEERYKNDRQRNDRQRNDGQEDRGGRGGE